MRNINRRDALKKTAYIMGGTLMAPTVAGILKGCSPKPELNWTPSFFTEEQARMITTIADIILPKTDTPAASELGVPGFIEEMVSLIGSPEERDQFVAQILSFNAEAEKVTGQLFNELSSDEQEKFVNTKHEEISSGNIDWNNRPLLWTVKELTIAGYCLTEVGATQMLQHIFIPGKYDACLPIEEAGNGKTWAM